MYPEEYINVYSLVNNDKTKLHINLTTKAVEILLNKTFSKWSYATFLDAKTIIDKIKEKSFSYRIHSLSVIKRFIKYKGKENTELYKIYSREINELYELHNLNREEQKKTVKEEANWMKYEDMKKILNDYIPKYLMSEDYNFYDMRDLIILSLYILQTPVRLGNYANMKIVKNITMEPRHLNDKFNYILKEGNKYKVVYNKYKTFRHLGQLEFIIKNRLLINLIDKYENYFFSNREDSEYFLTLNNLKTKMSTVSLEQSITKKSKQLFKKDHITLNLIRHSFFTGFFKTNPSIKEQRLVAREANHKFSPSMSLQYARLD